MVSLAAGASSLNMRASVSPLTLEGILGVDDGVLGSCTRLEQVLLHRQSVPLES